MAFTKHFDMQYTVCSIIIMPIWKMRENWEGISNLTSFRLARNGQKNTLTQDFDIKSIILSTASKITRWFGQKYVKLTTASYCFILYV